MGLYCKWKRKLVQVFALFFGVSLFHLGFGLLVVFVWLCCCCFGGGVVGVLFGGEWCLFGFFCLVVALFFHFLFDCHKLFLICP